MKILVKSVLIVVLLLGAFVNCLMALMFPVAALLGWRFPKVPDHCWEKSWRHWDDREYASAVGSFAVTVVVLFVFAGYYLRPW